MAVKQNNNTQCRYEISQLEDKIFLIEASSNVSIQVNEWENAYSNSFPNAWTNVHYYGNGNGNVYEIKGYNLSINEESELDNRYLYNHSINMSVNGYLTHKNLNGRYYVGVRDKHTKQCYLINPDFPVKVETTYTLTDNEDYTSINLHTASNMPFMPLNASSFPSYKTISCEGYKLYGFEYLKAIEYDYCRYDYNNNSFSYSNDGFKALYPLKNSFEYTETFNGETISQNLEFSIPLNQVEETTFFMEFNPNKYVAVIQKKDGSLIAGLNNGLLCTRSIDGTSGISDFDVCKIRMFGTSSINEYDSFVPSNPSITGDSSTRYVYTDEYDAYECENGQAFYLLQKQVDAFGNPTGRYLVFNGYQSRFPGLNIVGTFNDKVYFNSPNCSKVPDVPEGNLPSGDIEFGNDCGCKHFTYSSSCDWTVENVSPGISVSPMSGKAGILYDMTICNNVGGGCNEGSFQICTCGICNDYNITTGDPSDKCFSSGMDFYIDYRQQNITIPVSCCVKAVRTNLSYQLNNYSYVVITVPQNDDSARIIGVYLDMCDYDTQLINIHQEGLKVSTGGTLPSTVEITDCDECKSYTFSANTDWTIESVNGYTEVSPKQGNANQVYTIKICNGEQSFGCNCACSNPRQVGEYKIDSTGGSVEVSWVGTDNGCEKCPDSYAEGTVVVEVPNYTGYTDRTYTTTVSTKCGNLSVSIEQEGIVEYKFYYDTCGFDVNKDVFPKS